MKGKIIIIFLMATVLGLFSACGDGSDVSDNRDMEMVDGDSGDMEMADSDNSYDGGHSDYEDEDIPSSFYEILRNEYEKTPELVYITRNLSIELNGVTYCNEFSDWEHEEGTVTGCDCYLISYEIPTGILNKVKLYSSSQRAETLALNDIVYFDGYIYYIKEDLIDPDRWYEGVTLKLCKSDLKGNEILSYDLGNFDSRDHVKIDFISASGDVLCNIDADGNYLLVNAGFDNAEEIPDVPIEGEHGVVKERKATIFGIYNNEMYASVWVGNGLPIYAYKYNLTTKEWTDMQHEVHSNSEQLIGKYAVFESYEDDGYTIFDMESGETIATINAGYENFMAVEDRSLSDKLARFFKFGSTHILQDGQWSEVEISGDGSASYTILDSDLGYEENRYFISVVNEEYYGLRDGYGIFLRSFEKGEDEEIDIVRYED